MITSSLFVIFEVASFEMRFKIEQILQSRSKTSGPPIFLRLWSLPRLVATHLNGVGLFSLLLVKLKRFQITVYCVKPPMFLEYLSFVFDSTILLRKSTIPKSIPITRRETCISFET